MYQTLFGLGFPVSAPMIPRRIIIANTRPQTQNGQEQQQQQHSPSFLTLTWLTVWPAGCGAIWTTVGPIGG